VRTVSFTEGVRAEVLEAASAKGFTADFVDGCLAAIARDISKVFDTLILGPPDHPERRTYLRRAEALGLVEAICEEQGDDVIVVRLQVGAFG
jgi:hypothetical protein